MPVLPGMTPRILPLIQFLALTALALALVPAGAHLFEMPGKLALPPETYMSVQTIYAGWALFAVPIFLSVILLAWHAWLVRSARPAMWLSLLAVALILVTQAVFWAYTQPMNALTQNWAVAPPDIAAARQQWEVSHAVNAAITSAAFLAGAGSVIAARNRLA